MNYASIKKTDVANGPGVRVSLFVSGCTHHCPGCFNAETWDFGFGQPYTEETEQEILEALDHDYIWGITFLGGEPFEDANRPTVLDLAIKIRKRFPEKTIWCYTGYTYETDLLRWIEEGKRDVLPLLQQLDVLVDGEFIAARKNLRLAFRGSDNQRIINVPESLKAGNVILEM
ncbi:MAG: anaerobic ribonucleoside-triphosphate reductase activating protein [Lachnospiraceae bacterium]|nr:anaerobic ribonucleoside-triphosphate reductase activating protein [Lachnospiraceae bacterium]